MCRQQSTGRTHACAACKSAQRSPHMVVETRWTFACAARRIAQRSPHMIAETLQTHARATRRTRACAVSIVLGALCT